MRILVVSNLYPPNYVGGYELGCEGVVEELKARGHDVRVLTSTFGIGREKMEGGVHRWLEACLERAPDLQTIVQKELVNQRAFRQLCNDFQPAVVFLWNLSHISVTTPFLAQEMGFPTCYFVSDNWLATWKMDHWYQLWNKRLNPSSWLLRFLCRFFRFVAPPISLDLSHVIFASHFIKSVAENVGLQLRDASVIPWGVDVKRFPYKEAGYRKPKRLLYVGQIVPHKGLHTAIHSLAILKKEYGYGSLELTIAGDVGLSAGYTSYLRNLAETSGVAENVKFIGCVAHDDIRCLYPDYDILIFPSTWNEPFGITLLEAMSSGLAVVSTGTGGSLDILNSGFNALIFPREDPRSCAQQIARLLENPQLVEFICGNARKTVEERFRIDLIVNSIERVLKKAALRAGAKEAALPWKQKAHGNGKKPTEAIPYLALKAEGWREFLRNIKWVPGFVRRPLAIPPLLVFPFLFDGFFLLKGQRRNSLPIELDQIQSVVVTQLADMGDVILSGPFLRELRCLLPNAWIGLIVQPAIYNLVEKCPYVDAVFGFNWRAVKNWRTATHGHLLWWLQVTRFAKEHLWNRRIDLAISPRWNNDSCQAASLILMRASGAPWRVGYLIGRDGDGNRGKPLLERLLTHGPARGYPKHELDRQLDVLRYLGADVVDTSLEMWTAPEDESFAHQALETHGLKDSDPVIALAPGAAWQKRRWPVDRFVQLGRWLQECYSAYILIVGSTDDHELGCDLERGLERERTINLVGKTTLRQLASSFRHCKLFVGNDSGPLDVAAAAGIPVVGFFGSGEYDRFKPWGTKHEGVRLGLLCSPCWENCMFDRPHCIEGITVEDVKKVVSKKLQTLLRDAA